MRQSEPRHVNWERNLLKRLLQSSSRGKLKQLRETLSQQSPGTNWTCSQHPFFGEYFIITMKNSNRRKLPCAAELKYILFHLFKILTGQNLFIFSYSWKVVESHVYPPKPAVIRKNAKSAQFCKNSCKFIAAPGNLFPLSLCPPRPGLVLKIAEKLQNTAISVSITSLSGQGGVNCTWWWLE